MSEDHKITPPGGKAPKDAPKADPGPQKAAHPGRLPNGRFAPNHSGNKNGRPPKLVRTSAVQQVVADIMDVYEEPVLVRRRGKEAKVPGFQLAAQTLMRKVINEGDAVAAWRVLKNYMEVATLNQELNASAFKELEYFEKSASEQIANEGRLSKVGADILNQFRRRTKWAGRKR